MIASSLNSKKSPIDYLKDEINDHLFHSSKIKERVDYFLKALLKFEPLNLKMIKSIAFYGIPDEIRSLRPLIWRVVLGYLPAEKAKWLNILQINKEIYESFVKDLIEKKNEEILALGDDFLKECDWERFLLEKDLETSEKFFENQEGSVKMSKNKENSGKKFEEKKQETVPKNHENHENSKKETLENQETSNKKENQENSLKNEILDQNLENQESSKKKETFETFETFSRNLENLSNHENSQKTEILEQNCAKKTEPTLSEKKKLTALYNDLSLWDEIEKDTKRTRSEMHFFVSSNTENFFNFPLLLKLNLCLNSKLRTFSSDKSSYEKLRNDISEKNELHNDLLTRILFIYAKLNPGIKYVQGMNEIAGTLYFCFANDKNELLRKTAEIDTFFCFTLIMGEIKDGFIRNLDQAPSGLKGRIQDLNNLLKKIDRSLWEHFEEEKVNPYFYSLRWIMLLLTQEFEMQNIMRVWDSLLSHENKVLYLNYCCVAIIESMKEELIKEDFSGIMEKLQQNVNCIDIQGVMNLAYRLYLEFSGKEQISTFVIL